MLKNKPALERQHDVECHESFELPCEGHLYSLEFFVAQFEKPTQRGVTQFQWMNPTGVLFVAWLSSKPTSMTGTDVQFSTNYVCCMGIM